MKGVLISGYYGFNNTGDEAMIETLASQLAKRNYRLVVLSSNPDKTRELYNVEAYDRFKFFQIWKGIKNTDILVSGGKKGSYSIPRNWSATLQILSLYDEDYT